MLDPVNILGLGYFSLIACLWVLAALDYQLGTHKVFAQIGGRTYPAGVFCLRMAFIILGAMAALRGLDVANDTNSYYHFYQEVKMIGHIFTTRMEVGYVALNVLFAKLFPSGDTGFHALVFCTSVFSYFALEQWLEKHAKSYGLCILIFYFLLNGVFMSAIRQTLAISIVLLSLNLLENKKYLLFVAGVAIASLFHHSAWIALLFLLFATKKYNWKWATGLVAVTLLAVSTNWVGKVSLWYNPQTSYVFGEIGNAANATAVSLFYFCILLISLFSKKNTNQAAVSNLKFTDDFFAFSILITLTFTLSSLRGPILDRFGYYFALAGLPYTANVINRMNEKKYALLVKLGICMILWAYSLVVLKLRPEWQHLWPYHFFWE